MKLGSPKYGGSGIQIDLNPRTTTNTAGGSLFNGLANNVAAGGGYHSHHPTSFANGSSFSGGQFITPSHQHHH